MSFGSFTNSKNPIIEGVNQGQQSTMPRLAYANALNRQTLYPDLNKNKNNSSSSIDISGLVNGGLSLMKGLGSLKGSGNSGIMEGEAELSLGKDNNDVTNSLGGSIFSNAGDLYNLYSSISGNGSSGSGLFSGGSSGGSGIGAYGGLISGGINGLGSFAQSGDYKDGLQGMFGVDDENQSEIMQAINGTKNGAMMGSSFGPWGAAIGGILGLGSSFLDDI